MKVGDELWFMQFSLKKGKVVCGFNEGKDWYESEDDSKNSDLHLFSSKENIIKQMIEYLEKIRDE